MKSFLTAAIRTFSIYFFILFISLSTSFAQESNFKFDAPENEIGCMRHFRVNALGLDSVNAFLLAKFSEQLYPERLDLQLRMLKNNGELPSDLVSTDELKKYPQVDNSNFKVAFQTRFEHYFDTIVSNNEKTSWNFLEKSQLDTTRLLWKKAVHGYDPECMVIGNSQMILIVFRGTDDIRDNRFAEWIGTDFNIRKFQSDSVFNFAKLHKGFWKSFELIRDDLKNTIDNLNPEGKKIWLSGHSLGGAMAILSGLYLEKLGYDVQGVYSFSGPKAIGDNVFSEMANQSLGKKIQRFEYSLDPVSILWSPGYEPVGQRNWFDNAGKGNYKLYKECQERYFLHRPFEFRQRRFASDEKKEAARLIREMNCGRLTKLPYRLYHHNTQWTVKATYMLLPHELRQELPFPQDTYPFIYYGWSKGR
jgi:triacylglycerol lipase